MTTKEERPEEPGLRGSDSGEKQARWRTGWPGYLGLGIAASVFSFVLEEWLVQSADAPHLGWVGLLRLVVVVSPWVLVLVLLVRRVVGRQRTPWLSFGIGVALPWMLILAFFFGPSLVERFGRCDFDAAAWRAAAWKEGGGSPSEERIKMVDDLIASGVLDDKQRAEVVILLGPDDSAEGTGWGEGYFSDWDAVYVLGQERGFIGIDCEWLVIRYGDDGRVREYRIVTD